MKGSLALTHVPSPSLSECELTFRPASPIDFRLACRQHAGYGDALRELGVEVRTLDVNSRFPDGVFIEDTAIVLDEVAIVTTMGTAARRGELPAILPILAEHRQVERLEPPATIEGGDVLRVGRRLLVGVSRRTNAAAVDALCQLTTRYGYETVAVPVHGCLHLKTACTALPDGRLLVNLRWIDGDSLPTCTGRIQLPEEEPWAANVVCIGDRVLASRSHPRTTALLERLGFLVRGVDISEFEKAEGGVTCLSLLFGASPARTPLANSR